MAMFTSSTAEFGAMGILMNMKRHRCIPRKLQCGVTFMSMVSLDCISSKMLEEGKCSTENITNVMCPIQNPVGKKTGIRNQKRHSLHRSPTPSKPSSTVGRVQCPRLKFTS